MIKQVEMETETVRDLLQKMSTDEILEALDRELPDHARVLCLELGRRRAQVAVPKLLALASSSDIRLCEAAVEALGLVGDASVGEKLVSLLDDKEQPASVRDTVAHAIGRIGYRPGRDALSRALEDPEQSVKLCALGALLALKSEGEED